MLLLWGYALLVSAWLVGNPPGAVPDEPAHYVKAVATAGGDPYGAPGAYGDDSGIADPQRVWINRSTRALEVPPRLAPPAALTCNAVRPELSFRCIDDLPHEAASAGPRQLSYVGTYQPYLYVIPGALARQAEGWADGLRLARVAVAASCLLLVAVAVAALWSPGSGSSLLGIFVAFTPMAAFLAASMNTSGFEIAAGICLAAGVLRFSRDDVPSRAAWAAVGLGAVVVALSRPLGPVWAAGHLACLPALVGFRGTLDRIRSSPRLGLLVGGAAALAVVLGIGWELALQPHPVRAPRDVLAAVVPAIGDLPQALREMIGVFGWLDTEMPMPAYALWRTSLVGIAVVALLLGTRRQRVVLCGAGLAAAAVTVGVSAGIVRQTQFNMQGRYVLPFTVLVALLAGEIVFSSRTRLDARRVWALPAIVGTVLAAVHFVGWFANARRYAVGNRGPIFFFAASEWSPPLGWPVWTSCAALGALAVAAASVVVARRDRPSGDAPATGPADVDAAPVAASVNGAGAPS